MRSSAPNAFRLLALCIAGGACVWLGIQAANEVEIRSHDALSDLLQAEDFDWTTVEMDGLLAELGGEAPDEAARFRALALAGTALNPANLRDAMTVAPQVAVAAPEHRLEILRVGDQITVHGLLPGGDEARATLFEALGRTGEGIAVSDLLTSTNVVPSQRWPAAVAVAVDAVSRLENARVTLRKDTLAIDGLASDRDSATQFRRDLAAQTPQGLNLDVNLRLPRAVVSPFVTRFRKDEDGARFESCLADNEAGLARIEAAARDAGAIGPIRCRVALGAPDALWSDVAAAAIAALSDIGSGTVTISDLTVTLVPEETVVIDTVSEATTALSARLPEIYTLTVLSPQGETSPGTTARLAFSATRSPEGLVNVRGPLADRRSSSIVETYARALFGSEGLHLSLRQQPGLPTGWSVKILAGLEALGKLKTGSLDVTPGMVRVRGTTGDSEMEDALARGLTTALGASALYELDITYLKALDPVADAPTPQECVDAVNAVLSQEKITFPSGSTDLNGESQRIVARIAEKLKSCPGTRMEIGGHTDSQGRESMNESLSQQRADAVFNALQALDVLVAGLTSVGYGEAEPIADNDTAEGREENRRIAFRLIEEENESAEQNSDAASEDGTNGQE